ncbi:MAG: glucosidase [Bacteroidetes bacterium]|nr:glucosidase [Bacteroidota bacterium]
MNNEQQRLTEAGWKKWGPYVSDRQWGTVREDYSIDGEAWKYTTHDMARSKTWRWGEEGIAGICDDLQLLCFAIALWNGKDPILKERYFGLTNQEGNHGEDVKELYYYLENTPTHSYMRMLYKYPQSEFPYELLIEENKRRSRNDPEFEIIDTGLFDDDKYFDVFVEYAKQSPEDILIKISIANRGKESATVHLLPTLWFRNTWSWGYDNTVPRLNAASHGVIEAWDQYLGQYWLFCEASPSLLFCNNETNNEKLYKSYNHTPYCKDGINDYIVHGAQTINPGKEGTKAAAHYELNIGAGETKVIRLRLSNNGATGFDDFDSVMETKKNEADIFYNDIFTINGNEEEKRIARQAFAGMLWSKQFYYYNVHQWLSGDPAQPKPPAERYHLRNHEWQTLNTKEILSMPDKWEYPWFAAWDLAFHCLPLAIIDTDFAKQQLIYLTKEWYMHPNGKLPAYEWEFNDCNPPVHALITWEIYRRERDKNNGNGDLAFLEKVFHKLMLNFTWWVNKEDEKGDNIFEGGFLGMDNIGVFDRNAPLPTGGYIEQSDGTSWMAMYSLNLLRIATELAKYNKVYSDIAAKFFEHFLYIAGAMAGINSIEDNLWDEEDNFYYDRLHLQDDGTIPLKVRSLVGLIPLFVVEIFESSSIQSEETFNERMKWFGQNRPDLANLVSHWNIKNSNEKHLLSLLRGYRMKKTLQRLLDENEFLSDYGIRSVSKYHLKNPYSFYIGGQTYSVHYTPGESDSGMFGGNSNWRGPIWLPMNYLIIEGLSRFYEYYGDEFKVECPTGSGKFLNLNEVVHELRRRITSLFVRGSNDLIPSAGENKKIQYDHHFKDYVLFHEYFNGDTGKGLGASHQTGWTGIVAVALMKKMGLLK